MVDMEAMKELKAVDVKVSRSNVNMVRHHRVHAVGVPAYRDDVCAPV